MVVDFEIGRAILDFWKEGMEGRPFTPNEKGH